MDEAIRVLRFFVDNGDKKEPPVQDESKVLGHIAKIIEYR